LKDHDVLDAVKRAIEKIKSNCEFTAINAFLTNSNQFIAVRVSDESHTLFYHVGESIFEISTEAVEKNWVEMENSSVIFSQRKKERIEFQTFGL